LLVLEDRTLPSTLTVLNNADHGDDSLRAVIAAAQNGDQIVFDPSLRGETITLTSGELAVAKSLDIEGLGADQLAVSGSHQSRIFDISGAVTITIAGLTITDGLVAPGTTDALGGGILNNGGDTTLDNVVIQNNVVQGGDAAVRKAPGYSGLGGGIYSTSGALTLAGVTIANNQALGGRGGDSSSYVSAGSGGAASGGGLYASGGSLDISDSRIANNAATGGRGGDGLHTTFGDHGGVGGDAQGGGLYVNGGSLTVASSTIASNQATGGAAGRNGDYAGPSYGGGLYTSSSAGTPTVTGSTLFGNSASSPSFSGISGGGIYNAGTLMVSDTTLSENAASGFGPSYGGGILNAGTLMVSGSTLSDNAASSTYSFYESAEGGGILTGYNNTLTVSDSTLSGNSASYDGGGIWTAGTLTVSDSTLSGNSADHAGGISADALPGRVTLTNVTVTANRATSYGGGGLFVGTGAPVLHNTLIAGNFRGATGTARDDVYGALHPGGAYNLIGDGTGMTGLQNGVNGNLVGSASAPIDPLLGPLQNNGGPTQTMALLPGSPALNAGDPGQLRVPDQRGVVRTGGVNIGAYQASATAFLLDAPATVPAGVPFDVTVTAVDPFGQVAVGYSGTVTFSTTDQDSGVVLPADYTFMADDGGLHTFTDTGLGETTLRTPGDQMLTVTDTADVTITGSATVTVDPAASVSSPDGIPRPSDPGPAATRDWIYRVVSKQVVISEPKAVDQLFASLEEQGHGRTQAWWPDPEPIKPVESNADLRPQDNRLVL
jgi:hypothetical protein